MGKEISMEERAKKARAMRYKRPALDSMGYEQMVRELEEIAEACSDIRYYIDTADSSLLEALCGEDDDEQELQMMFAELSGKADELYEKLIYIDRDEYDDCTVSLIGRRYRLIGYDAFEEDYFNLTRYEEELAGTEAGKRLMRKTKAEMISTIGQCLGTLLAFIDLRQQYDYLKGAFDILRGENAAQLNQVKEIEKAYEECVEQGQYSKAWREFDKLVEAMPDRVWIE